MKRKTIVCVLRQILVPTMLHFVSWMVLWLELLVLGCDLSFGASILYLIIL